MDVFADCADSPARSERARRRAQSSKATGKVYDRIFVRHWDTWSDGAHLAAVRAAARAAAAQSSRVALSGALDADVPSKPFGDASEYAFSPDGTQARVRRAHQGQDRALVDQLRSLRSARRRRRPRNLTADNPAWDTQPVFSPRRQHARVARDGAPRLRGRSLPHRLRDLTSGAARALDRGLGPLGRTRSRSRPTARRSTRPPIISASTRCSRSTSKTGKPTMLTGPGRVESFASASKRDRVRARVAEVAGRAVRR